MNDRATAAPGHFWTTVEVAVLRAHYAQHGGPERCAELLPHRGIRAVYAKANHLRLGAPNAATQPGKRFARKYATTAEIDQRIRDGYARMRRRGDLQRLALEVARPAWWVSKRAVTLGLTRERIRAAEWSREEVALLHEWATCVLPTIRLKLKAAGFARSETAIAVKLKRLQIDCSDPDVWTATELASLLGVNGKTVADWVHRRGLVAKLEGGGANGVFRIRRAALRAWLKDHHGHVDLRRVDQAWFWGLVL